MIAVGTKVKVVYDPRPFFSMEELEGVVTKITKAGFIKIKTEEGAWDDVLFNVSCYGGSARGWNTLHWEVIE